MTVCPTGGLGKYRFWYAAEQENVLLPTDAKTITSGNPGYKRLRVAKVAKSWNYTPSGHGWMHETHLTWVFSGEPVTERCQPTR